MLLVKTDNAVAAWRKALAVLLADQSNEENDKYFRDQPMAIELRQATLEKADPLFPMSQEDLDIINRFIYTGEKEEQVCHEWTRLYYHRIFDEPNSQVEYLLEKLRLPEPVGEAQISLWDKNIDQGQEISPCTQIIWGRKRGDTLELHVHTHSSDAYKKLLMNLQEFISLHQYLAGRLDLNPGRYIHFLDSCHIHRQDKDAALALLKEFDKACTAS